MTIMVIKIKKLALMVFFVLGLVACTVFPTITATPVSTEVRHTPSPIQTGTPTAPVIVQSELPPTTTLNSTSTATLTVSPSPVHEILSNPRVMVLAQGLAGPDDLVLAPDGSIYISDVSSGKIQQVQGNGSVRTVVSGLSEPEGMVFLPDGSLVIAEQGKNRLVRYDFKAKHLGLFLALKNQTGQAGVDGIVLDVHDPSRETIIIPDSPNGAVRQSSLDGMTVVTLATGFARPTGAWVEPDGSLLVVDENAGRLARIHAGGSAETLASLSIPDDVVEDPQGNIFVATLGDHAIHVISGPDYRNQVLTAGLSAPQGIILAADGNLIVADQGNHRVIKLLIH
jgi:sugar lactone lactonase YvrE